MFTGLNGMMFVNGYYKHLHWTFPEFCQKHLWPELHAAVLTSATLFVDNNCEPVKQELGLESALEHCFPYNFDYQSQACMYIPKNIADPTDPRFAEEAANQIAELVQITEGGAFVLCTSYGNLRIYEKALREAGLSFARSRKPQQTSVAKKFRSKQRFDSAGHNEFLAGN